MGEAARLGRCGTFWPSRGCSEKTSYGDVRRQYISFQDARHSPGPCGTHGSAKPSACWTTPGWRRTLRAAADPGLQACYPFGMLRRIPINCSVRFYWKTGWRVGANGIRHGALVEWRLCRAGHQWGVGRIVGMHGARESDGVLREGEAF